MENLFVRVNFNLQSTIFGKISLADYHDHGVPFLYWGPKAHACKRHVMEIDSVPEPQRYGHSRDRHFILASDDLPMFCKTLLTMDGVRNLRNETELLRGMELWITIGDEVGTTREDLTPSYMSPDDKKVESLDATTKNAAHREGAIDSLRTITKSNTAIRENRNGSGSPNVNRITTAESRLPEAPSDIDNSRLRKLLEPLRALYSVGFSYIDAPISERYRHEIQTSLSRARPGIDVRFHVPSSAFEEAMRTFSAEDFALAIQKLRGTLDTLLDFQRCCRSHEMMSNITTGPFAALSFREAAVKMRYLIWNHLARANLKFHRDIQHVRTAQACVLRIMDAYIDSQWQSGTHEFAMIHYLEAEIWEALDQLGEHTGRPRSDTLQDVISMLTHALGHEPGNAMLKQELERRQREKRTAEVIEEARKWERDEGRVLSRERIV